MPATVLLDILNACSPAEGICTGGRPNKAQLEQARERGITHVVNLCPPEELAGFPEAKIVTDLGMQYTSIPVRGAADLTEDNARRLASAIAKGGKVLVHCASGNRAGALFALKGHFVDGLEVEDALVAGRAAGLKSLEPTVRGILSGAAVH